MCNIPWDTIGKFLQGFLTLVIAGGVGYVAFAQYAINRRQYRLALFEKRFAIYNAVAERCADVVRTARSTAEENIAFIQATRDETFLFGPEIHQFIDEIWKRGNDLYALQAMVPREPAQETPIVLWFNDQLREARKIFFKYIDFTDDY